MSERDAVSRDAESIAQALADFGRGFAFPRVDRDAAEVARESAAGAWLRSLSRKRSELLGAYRSWAEESVPRMARSARYVINQQQYDILVRRTGEDLARAWRSAVPERPMKLSYGAAFRTIDLLFMAIDASERCRQDAVRPFLHVPLDATTLKPLRGIIDELVDSDFSVEIPATINQGFVATEEQYCLLQGAISALARRSGVAPIVYAHWCAGRDA